MTSKMRWQASASMLALLAFAVAVLYAPAADTAPGDVADLGIAKSDSPDPVFVGAVLTYAIQVTNLGPQEATGVTVTDELPSHATFVSASASSGSCEQKGKRVTCNLGNLAMDPTKANAVTVTIQVRPTKTGTLTNTASVDSVENDPIGANDEATVSTQVTAPVQAASCRGATATVPGTPGADRLVGTAGPDVIVGLGGADAIFGLSGRDLVCAGGGNDRVNAGPAADRVFGGAGADLLRGRGGPDLLTGNPGTDVLAGNAGSDRLRGGRGFDLCAGGAGLDRERGCER
ncbi:MAG TPA: hypothetical protein VFW48_09905 [Solirubrobacterales bacterium]|nr:hypothetical protein [Solirubrobacterales bacterium]